MANRSSTICQRCGRRWNSDNLQNIEKRVESGGEEIEEAVNVEPMPVPRRTRKNRRGKALKMRVKGPNQYQRKNKQRGSKKGIITKFKNFFSSMFVAHNRKRKDRK